MEEHRVNKRIHSKYNLHKFITTWRHEDPKLEQFNAKACQTTANELFAAYRSFFNLIKKDPNARPPKFIENTTEYHTVSFNQTGWIFKHNNSITINKISPISYKAPQWLGDISKLNIKHISISYRNDKWILNITIEGDIEPDLPKQHKVLAIDLGLKVLGTGVDNDGNVLVIPNKPKSINQYFKKQISKVKDKQSKLSKGSRRWKRIQHSKSKLYRKKNSQIKQALHVQSKKISSMNYKTIVVGDLKVKKLMSTEGVNSGYKGKGLRKSFAESNLGMFIDILSYKCKEKGTDVIKVDERHTTQLNCLTGKMFKEHIPLEQREVEISPDLWIDRDLNSAINILKRYESQSIALVNAPLNVVRCIDRHGYMYCREDQEAAKSLA
jgi:putative transposase